MEGALDENLARSIFLHPCLLLGIQSPRDGEVGAHQLGEGPWGSLGVGEGLC